MTNFYNQTDRQIVGNRLYARGVRPIRPSDTLDALERLCVNGDPVIHTTRENMAALVRAVRAALAYHDARVPVRRDPVTVEFEAALEPFRGDA